MPLFCGQPVAVLSTPSVGVSPSIDPGYYQVASAAQTGGRPFSILHQVRVSGAGLPPGVIAGLTHPSTPGRIQASGSQAESLSHGPKLTPPGTVNQSFHICRPISAQYSAMALPS